MRLLKFQIWPNVNNFCCNNQPLIGFYQLRRGLYVIRKLSTVLTSKVHFLSAGIHIFKGYRSSSYMKVIGSRSRVLNVIPSPAGLSDCSDGKFVSVIRPRSAARLPVTAAACEHLILLFRSRPADCADFIFSDPQIDHVMTERVCTV